jgi:CO/xanthine dehydrogenase Mo-binding subunit
MKNIDSFSHTKGESIYLDDIPEISGTLFGACFDSPVAHGVIKDLDLSEALKSEGVVRIFPEGIRSVELLKMKNYLQKAKFIFAECLLHLLLQYQKNQQGLLLKK